MDLHRRWLIVVVTSACGGATATNSGGDAAIGIDDAGAGHGGAAAGGTGGVAIAPLPPLKCSVDADCAVARRIDSCCGDCPDAFSTAFIRASGCVVGLGESAPGDCRPANCAACAPSSCPAVGGAFCDNGTCRAAAGPGGYDCARARAFCPPDPPTDGGDCCNAQAGSACETVCLASTFSCRYDRCLQGGQISHALCTGGRWQRTAVACPICPISCPAGTTCVVFEGAGTSAECRENACGPGYVDCGCASGLCDHPGAVCGPDGSGGHVLACSIATAGM